ncbi:MAG: Rod shape-determining protein RodA [uncultured Rubrobacteraceae bacterium]|uniref:Peptidoglycan glycosyltransferase RodA n=1 Tax=uncultured Rubrobacteraceae bacterium TaxID=349277 RepID=A0A6J4S130_9ACTN|nr:MAG: Rod shape-determining protein RodA [uncultured Rubrobacteraceae bacterium]
MSLTREDFLRREVRKTRKESPRLWRSMDVPLLLVSLALSGFGILAVYVAGTDTGEAYAATNQAIGFIIGFVAAIPLAIIDYRLWKRFLRPIYGLAIVMLLAVTLMGATANGATSWLDIGPVRVQPSEFAKPLVVIVLAGFFAEKAAGEHEVFLKALGIMAVPGLLVLVQPDLGTATVFGAVFLLMAYVAGARLIQLGGLVLAGVLSMVAGVKLGILEEYQVARLTSFMSQSEAGDLGYQVAQSKMAIGSGGITGKGFDATTLANLGFLPEHETDFIFSNLAERVGFVGSMLLILLFFVLIWRILHVATISRDRFGVLIAVGIGTMFLFHVLVNIGMTMGIMPVTGIPLPFISYGRSSLVVSVMSLGLLQSIAMRSRSEVSKTPKV